MRLPPWMWKVIRSRKTKIALASAPFVICLLVLLVYFGASWWGKSRAERLLRDMESAGYAVDPEKYWVPAKDPHADLFKDATFQQELEDPLLIPLAYGETKMANRAKRLPRAEPNLARLTDLTRWLDPPMPDERAAAGFLLKERHDAVMRLEALQPVLSRSKEAVWPVTRVRNGFTGGPELANVTGSMMKLRYLSETAAELAIAHFVVGEGNKAAAAVLAMLDVARLEMDPKPALTSIILADVMLRRIQAVIWEGGMRGGWNEDQLKPFDQALATLRPQQAAVKAYLGEIAHLRSQTRWYLSHYARALPEIDDDWHRDWTWDWQESWDKTKKIASEFRPPGLILAGGVKSQRESFELAARFDEGLGERFTPADLIGFRRMRDGSPDSNSLVFGSPGSAMVFAAECALRMEATIALTRTGIALERHRLRVGDGKYPASLEALVPEFLPEIPLDPLTGEALRFQLRADGSPYVWSVGGNLTDDGGKPHREFGRGDLIWITQPIPGLTEKDLFR
ncbi:hypothetical protein OKA05_05165 [Luteolibacter arcticus]|uniref:Uncharacterized protein n=1 Tax=Luteolibacter arcticus TaxID=1581411 RepID=A0ABT3GE81_9BACT|nr:hypothetical protein [Luteolibacter arcticus]MCW1921931.1 hypothetical protein [Luteolibacter arcticus]